MKKIITLLALTFCLNEKGQISFPEPKADWHFMVQNGGFSGPYYYTNVEVKYIKDTLIMGRNAKELTTTSAFRFPVGYNNSEQFIYTSNDSVFFFNTQTLSKFQLLYNFGASVGQSWQIHLLGNTTIDTINVKVDSIKNTLINSVSLKTLYVTYTGTTHQLFQVENHSVIYDRIGDINYLFNFTSDVWSTCDGCSSIEGLLCYQDSTFSLYQPDTSKPCNYNTTGISQISGLSTNISIYPNPNKGSFVIEPSNVTKQTMQVYDVNGKLVLSQAITGKTSIDASSLNEGVYNISLQSSEGVVNKRLVIVR